MRTHGPFWRRRDPASRAACLLGASFWAVCMATPGASTPAPQTSVAVFKDDIPAWGAPSAPDRLAKALEQAGFAVSLLESGQLANPAELNRQRHEVLVLPYGASFPVKAADNFRAFLRAGGKFFSTGGYAFDALLEKDANGWRAYRPPESPRLDGVAWFYDLPAAELRGRGRLTFRGWLRTDGVAGPGFAHFSIYQTAADGSLPAWRDLCQVRGSQAWKEYSYTFEVHPQAATVSLRAGLYRCRGTAWFDDAQITDEAGNALLREDFEAPRDPDGQDLRA